MSPSQRALKQTTSSQEAPTYSLSGKHMVKGSASLQMATGPLLSI